MPGLSRVIAASASFLGHRCDSLAMRAHADERTPVIGQTGIESHVIGIRRLDVAYTAWCGYVVMGAGSSRCSGLDGHGNMSPVKA